MGAESSVAMIFFNAYSHANTYEYRSGAPRIRVRDKRARTFADETSANVRALLAGNG